MTTKPLGLYIHIPFCERKCLYCDFYSFRCADEEKQRYVDALLKSIDEWSKKLCRKADTLYIGGGTPSTLSPKQIYDITQKVQKTFLTENAEITVEANPHSALPEFLKAAAAAGVNRMSFGLQSANENELDALGRRSTPQELEKAINSAYSAGIENVSADIMLGIPEQTDSSLLHSLDFALNLGIKHLSAYMLKIEENTPFYKMKDLLNLPDDDRTADLYELMCDVLSSKDALHYEISNFAFRGFESRHNLKYWRCEEYLGIGPAAHSFIDGKRFFYPRDIDYFTGNNQPVDDGIGGTEDEYIMLKLRLLEGITFAEFENRFSHPFDKEKKKKAAFLMEKGLVNLNESGFHLTEKGFLISNTVINQFI